MVYDKVLVVTDNHYLFKTFKEIIADLNITGSWFQFRCTSSKTELKEEELFIINVKKDFEKIISEYDLVISLHCKQIFPPQLINAVKCINVHPGLNPFNRGWYPQVFSIINKLPAGATIHVMDEEIDHGMIIDQEEIIIDKWDTSLNVYNKVLEAEIRLLKKNLNNIITNQFTTRQPGETGNYNGIKDFRNLLQIDLNEHVKADDFIDRIRALTHGNFRNAYFIDSSTKKKVYISIKLTPDE